MFPALIFDDERTEPAVLAERAEDGRRRRRHLRRNQHQRIRVTDDRVVLPAGQTVDHRTDGEALIVRRDHFAEAEGAHHLADRHRGEVGRLLTDPGPVGRVDRYPCDVNQGLTGSDLGDWLGDQVESVLIDRSIRSFSEQETAVFVGHPPILPRPGRWPFTPAVRIGLPSVQEYLHCLSGNVGRSQ